MRLRGNDTPWSAVAYHLQRFSQAGVVDLRDEEGAWRAYPGPGLADGNIG